MKGKSERVKREGEPGKTSRRARENASPWKLISCNFPIITFILLVFREFLQFIAIFYFQWTFYSCSFLVIFKDKNFSFLTTKTENRQKIGISLYLIFWFRVYFVALESN